MNLYEFKYTTYQGTSNGKRRKDFKSAIAPDLKHAMAHLPRDAQNIQLKRVRPH